MNKRLLIGCLFAEHWLNVYEEGPLLGSGGFGRVFAGIRKEDGLPVSLSISVFTLSSDYFLYVIRSKVDQFY